MNTTATTVEVTTDVDSTLSTLRDLIDVEVVLIGGGDIPSNGY